MFPKILDPEYEYYLHVVLEARKLEEDKMKTLDQEYRIIENFKASCTNLENPKVLNFSLMLIPH